MRIACLLAAGYLIGSIPFGVIVGKMWRGVDVRKHGSGNIGFTNVLRVLGPGPAAVVLLGDALKGWLPVALGRGLLREWEVPQPHLWLLAVALAPILGHSFSVFLRFRGGRAVTTTCGVLLAAAWPAAMAGLVVWLTVVAVTRYVSLASMVAGLSVPISIAVGGGPWPWTAFWAAVAALVMIRHLPNIRRLLAGTEARFLDRAEVEEDGS